MEKLDLAMAWYSKEQYDLFRKNCTDGSEMIATFNEWEKYARKSVAKLKKEGFTVFKVPINFNDYVLYCRISNIDMDGKARTAYAVSKFIDNKDKIKFEIL